MLANIVNAAGIHPHVERAHSVSGSNQAHSLIIFLHLARAFELRRQPLDRDKMLVLAGAEAAELGLHPIGAVCGRKILENNTGHMLRYYRSFAHALADDDFQVYLRQVRRAFPREKAELLLQEFGIVLGNEQATYACDYEYAASLLGSTPEELECELAANREFPRPTGDDLAPPVSPNWPLTIVLLGLLLVVVAWAVWQFLHTA